MRSGRVWFFVMLFVIISVVAAIGYVLIGNGLYDESIKHFSLLLQVSFAASLLLIHVLELQHNFLSLCSGHMFS